MSSDHPSYFALDRYAFGTADESVRAHVAGCAECARHLAIVTPAATIAPATVGRTNGRPRGYAFGGALSVAALAAVALLLVRSGGDSSSRALPEATTTVRGTPAVGVFVRRDARVELWDGVRRLEPGDAIRLKVLGEGFAHVTVFALDAHGEPSLLYRGALDPNADTLLPPAWRLDGKEDVHALAVVLSHRELEGSDPSVLERDRNDAELWVRRIVLSPSSAGAPGR